MKILSKVFTTWHSSRVTVTVLLLYILLAVIVPLSPASAQGLGNLRNFNQIITRPVIKSVRASLRIIPKLHIVRAQAGSVTGLHKDDGGNFLFVVLDDGTARLWDLQRGVQLGGAIGDDIITGAVQGSGHKTEAIAIRRDGSSLLIRPDGSIRLGEKRVVNIAPGVRPVLSDDGSTLAFRASDGKWRVMRNNRVKSLPEAAQDMQPILSRDGSRVIFHTVQGDLVARESVGGQAKSQGIGGCAEIKTPVTTGVFMPNGDQAVFGDASGNLCIWSMPQRHAPRKLLVQRNAHSGTILEIAVGKKGKFIATRSEDGTIAVWSIRKKLRPVAKLKPGVNVFGPLFLDADRKWILAGGQSGITAIYSFDGGKHVASLISTDHGWAVIDRKGRFDGNQHGIDSLVWAGETALQTLPVNAFSENYFEPGLLARLDDESPFFLNEKIEELSEDGYLPPPRVSIDPIVGHGLSAGDIVTVTVRIEPDYEQRVFEVRLYHNGKLSGQAVPGNKTGQVIKYKVRLSPGENTFAAVGVGPGKIEGPIVEVTTTIEQTDLSQPQMHVVGVGINDYGGVRDLLYSRNDANAVVELLRKRSRSLFLEVNAVTLLDESADASAIENRILQQSSSPQDVFLVYLAGHGFALDNETSLEWYFLPFNNADVWRSGAITPRKIREHGLSDRKIMDILTKISAQHVFLVLDSCKSGAVVDAVRYPNGEEVEDSVAQKSLRRIARVGGFHVLAASRANEDAFELDAKPHGALTFLVLEGLMGQADRDRNSIVSVREVIDYAAEEMPLLAHRLAQSHIGQKPVGYSSGKDFALTEPNQ